MGNQVMGKVEGGVGDAEREEGGRPGGADH